MTLIATPKPASMQKRARKCLLEYGKAAIAQRPPLSIKHFLNNFTITAWRICVAASHQPGADDHRCMN